VLKNLILLNLILSYEVAEKCYPLSIIHIFQNLEYSISNKTILEPSLKHFYSKSKTRI